MKKNILLGFIIFVTFNLKSQIQSQQVAYNDGNVKLAGYLVKPAQAHSKLVGVVILPAWMGISNVERLAAERLGELGYFAFVADIYGFENNPKDFKDAARLSSSYKQDFVKYQKRIALAIQEIIKQGASADNIAVMGYCFGGSGALETARGNLPAQAVISFHGGLAAPKREESTMKPKVLVLHGADDPSITNDDIINFQNEMRKAQANWQMNFYGNAVHSFTNPEANNPKSNCFNKEANDRSWEALLAFLKEVFN
ncbi:MAG: dienelactone hydrolase family protein [Alphaproteobacteria bacterium]|nr:dienelactone hydrolase family protein [Alphaproteobacteria bacterium]